MKYSIFIGLLSALAATSSFAATTQAACMNAEVRDSSPKPACANFAGNYQGSCITHWPGYEHHSKGFIKIWQGTAQNDAPCAGRAELEGKNCASISIKRWSGNTPKDIYIFRPEYFKIWASTHKSSAWFHGEENGQTYSDTAEWNSDQTQFIINRKDTNARGRTRASTTTYSHDGTHVLVKTTTEKNDIPSDCVYDLISE